ncbi:MAG: type I DNA topoisomerase [Nitrospirae bacterium]|nr:type I DNA topoisomerase [Nitrospirota bacterium]
MDTKSTGTKEKAGRAKSLVIVESPAKAKTINKFLGSEYVVKASVGHVRDLPSGKIGIDIENGFAPDYVVIKGKEEVIGGLRSLAKKSDAIYLCPDPDREGEAIAWHIAEEIGAKNDNVFRVTFNEITKDAILEAMKHPGRINMDRVEAQQARRVLDRLVGYNLSPLLWRKVRRGLSAGRVQSVAVKMVVDREREITAFNAEEYWSVTARLQGAEPPAFEAKLAKYLGRKLELPNEEIVNGALDGIRAAGQFVLSKIERKERKRNPAAPFTTSKLQQESARKLGFGAKKTMMLAQQLYEGVELGTEGAVGIITYMRTDSVRVADEAKTEAREFIETKYGKPYLPQKPPVYKSGKGAQEGHEAVRPTSVMRDPDSVKPHLTRDQQKLYTLIWNRFLASQMAPAVLDQTAFDIDSGDYTFRAAGTVVRFPGFMTIYTEGRDEAANEDDENKEGVLPALSEGAKLEALSIEPKQHFTQPPPRFTEATIVKELEEKGIGRPSTYAAIISTIQDRKYVEKKEGRFAPTELGVVVNDMLVGHFAELIDYDFTARMENELDLVEEGTMKWVDVVKDFYGPFSEKLEKAGEIKRVKPEDKETGEVCDKCGKPMVERWGRHGRFIACTGYPDCKNAKPLAGEAQAARPEPEQTDEVCDKCGKPMLLRTGKFGKFLACSGYPDCKATKPLKTGVQCPEDGGELVERRGRGGRSFYSCSNYPECKFAVWSRPVPKPCPKCNAPFMLERWSKDNRLSYACRIKECGHKEEAGV